MQLHSFFISDNENYSQLPIDSKWSMPLSFNHDNDNHFHLRIQKLEGADHSTKRFTT